MTRARRRLPPFALVVACLTTACTGGRTTPAPRPVTGGDPHRGQLVVRAAGCGACHEIAPIRDARGELGPPLTGFARRTYIAGELANTPENLMRWVMNPHSVEPRTAMPVLGLDESQARDVAAFLYTLE